jgi:hypothetical protein
MPRTLAAVQYFVVEKMSMAELVIVAELLHTLQ